MIGEIANGKTCYQNNQQADKLLVVCLGFAGIVRLLSFEALVSAIYNYGHFTVRYSNDDQWKKILGYEQVQSVTFLQDRALRWIAPELVTAEFIVFS